MTFAAPLLMLAAGTALLLAPTPSAAPTKYKAVTVTKQTVDLTALGGNVDEGTETETHYFQLESADSAGGHLLTLTIDSIAADPAAPSDTPKAARDSAAGSVYRIFVNASGTATVTAIAGGGSLSLSFASTVPQFWPRLTAERIAAGRWTDTTASVRMLSTGARNVQSVRSHQLADPTTLNATFASTHAGEEVGPAGPMSVTGTSDGTTQWSLGTNNVVTGLSRAERFKMSVSITGAPAPISISGTQATTISRLP